MITFISGSRQRRNICPGTMGTPRSLFSTDSHFLIVRNRVDVHPAVPERLGVGDLGWRRAPERERETGGERNAGKALRLGTVA